MAIRLIICRGQASTAARLGTSRTSDGAQERSGEAHMAVRAQAGAGARQSLFKREGLPPVGSLVLSLQHVLASFAGVITPAMMIATTCGFTRQSRRPACIIRVALILSAIDTLLQRFALQPHRRGAPPSPHRRLVRVSARVQAGGCSLASRYFSAQSWWAASSPFLAGIFYSKVR